MPKVRSRLAHEHRLHHFAIEPLEERRLLVAGPIISEFMAVNASGISDQFGNHADWIELRNTSAATINLAGWHLTDEADNLTKWTFPGINLAAGGSLVVFASGRNLTSPAAPLHTNFSLDGNGEYLGLVGPDGTTIAQQFAPYPPQIADISYGVTDTRTLLPSGTPAKTLVPTGTVVGDWSGGAEPFNDASWTSGPTPVGYEYPTSLSYDQEVLADNPIAYYRLNETTGTTAVDASPGISHSGTYVGTLTKGQASAYPGLGTSVRFQSNGRVRIPDQAEFSLGTGAYTVEMWFMTNNSARGDMFTNKGAGGDYGIHSGSQTAQTISVYHNGFTSQSSQFALGQWHHLVVTRSGTIEKIYLDGVPANGAGQTNTQTWNIVNDLLIGSNHDGNPSNPAAAFDGWIDEVAIYGDSLPPERIAQHILAASGTYRDVILADGPLGYYRFGEATPDAAATEAGSTAGTYNNFTAENLNEVGAIAVSPNTAAAFDGVDNFVQVPATLLSAVGTGAMSMELWFNKTPGSGRGDLINIKGAGGDFGIISDAADKLSVNWDGTVLAPGAEVGGGWHHLTFTRSGATAKLYLDGVQYSTTAVAPLKNISSIAAPIFIGSNHDNALVPQFAFNGKLDEVVFYNKALSIAQVTQHYQSGASNVVPAAHFNIVTNIAAAMYQQAASAYVRIPFTGDDPANLSSLKLRVMYDDGFVAYLNGTKIAERNAPASPSWNSIATAVHPNAQGAVFEDIDVSAFLSSLHAGTNILAIQGFNLAAGDDDFEIAAEMTTVPIASQLSTGYFSAPTPGAPNGSLASNVPSLVTEVDHSPQSPTPGQAVTITAKVQDLEGVGSVNLQYQIVDAGAYIDLNDAAYQTNWTTVAMTDGGSLGDAVAGDGVFTVILPAALQVNRRLVRYRMQVTDSLNQITAAPSSVDSQPNFAYFVYAGVPAWQGAIQPGSADPNKAAVVTYDPAVLTSVPTYFLITTHSDHVESQHIPNATTGAYLGDEYSWLGTLVYDGVVYDHIGYRSRGGVWRYAMGKNMWKFDFNSGHDFQAEDNYGQEYDVKWKKLNLSSIIQQGDIGQRGEQGLFESTGFQLFNLAGVPGPNTHYVSFRIVDQVSETGANQYSGDFQGLYLAVEQPDGRLLEEHGLPDGNLYKIEGGVGTANNIGDGQVTDGSDLRAFIAAANAGQTDQWWRDHFDLDSYYSYRAMVEAIHHWDIGFGKNYFYYHNPVTDKWQTVPWDLDLTWTVNYQPAGGDAEPFKSLVLSRPAFLKEYRNRLREIRDLLFNSEQTSQMIDTYAALVDTPGASLVDADRAMWDYNPILVSSYVTPSKAGNGVYYNKLANKTFAGEVQSMKTYVNTRTSYIDTTLLTSAEENAAPVRPTITSTSAPNFPVNALSFQTNNFAAGNLGGTFAYMEWRLAEVTNPAGPSYDPTAPKLYEINSVWESGKLATFNSSVTIPAGVVEPGHTYRARVKMADSNGRESHWSLPIEFVATALTDPLTTALRVTEVMYNPPAPAPGSPYLADDFEYIELTNTSNQPLNLTGAAIHNGIEFVFPNSSLAVGQTVLVVKNQAAFTSRYGAGLNIAGQFISGTLSNGSDILQVVDAAGGQVQLFAYNDSGAWPSRPDGLGASLEVLDAAGNYDDPENWRGSSEYAGSPGTSGLGPANSVVINEVLANPGAGQTDSIELYNPTGQTIDIGGWWLSDSTIYQKYLIPLGTLLSAGGYLVFDASQFNPTPGAPLPTHFGLDGAHGGDVWLMQADSSGNLLRFIDDVSFDAAASGVSIGRWPNGTGKLYPQASRTLGLANSGPQIGPVVISEVMYNPAGGNDDLEFIELYNITGAAVDIGGWRFDSGVTFTLPTGTILGPHTSLTVLHFDPAAAINAGKLATFRNTYGISNLVPLAGPYAGTLSNGGENVRLVRPDTPPPNEPNFIPLVLVDEVDYQDLAPWPLSADGLGKSLTRLGWGDYGDDPANWIGATGTPGSVSALVAARQVFYNGSSFDGADFAAGALDDGAISSGNSPLLPGGTATAANYTNYSRGINGLMIDVGNLAGTPTADDFIFRVGNDYNPTSWTLAPAPSIVAVRAGAGASGTDRVTLVWDDGAIKNTWLQVTVKATANTGLTANDVFYFGNAVGETGNSPTDAAVNSTDEIATRNNGRSFDNLASISFVYDFNRDGFVNATDQILARSNATTLATSLKLIQVPAGLAGQAAAADALVVKVSLAASVPEFTTAAPLAAADEISLGLSLSRSGAAATTFVGPLPWIARLEQEAPLVGYADAKLSRNLVQVAASSAEKVSDTLSDDDAADDEWLELISAELVARRLR